jgi:hypothetical protein
MSPSNWAFRVQRNKKSKNHFVYLNKNKIMTLTERKLNVVEYLKYERDEHIPELIETYGGDEQFVIDEVWGPLETCLDGKTDEDLINIVDKIMDDPSFEKEFEEFKEYMGGNWSIEELDCDFIWEHITNHN